jgi:hypothetical protein
MLSVPKFTHENAVLVWRGIAPFGEDDDSQIPKRVMVDFTGKPFQNFSIENEFLTDNESGI